MKNTLSHWLAFLLFTCATTGLAAQRPGGTNGGSPPTSYSAQYLLSCGTGVNAGNRVFRFDLRQDAEEYELSVTAADGAQTGTIQLLQLDVEDREYAPVFEQLLTNMFFEDVYLPFDLSAVEAERGRTLADALSGLDFRTEYDDVRETFYNYFQTDRRFPPSDFAATYYGYFSDRDSVRQAAENIYSGLEQTNRTTHRELSYALVNKGINFMASARQHLSATAGGSDTITADQLFTYAEEMNGTTIALYETTKSFLNRKSVTIGNQVYYLTAKEVKHKSGATYYVFNLSLGAKNGFFEMEGVQATANTINAMARKMERILQRHRLSRNRQLPPDVIGRISNIAERVDQRPADYSIQDDRFLDNAIRDAADNYGFDAYKLKEELTGTGIFAALTKRANYCTGHPEALPPVDLHRKISNATIRYTDFNEDIETTLRNIAADFLFTAYKNTIRVEEDSTYVIGTITLKDTVNFYRRGITYENFSGKMDRRKAGNKKYIPVGQLAFDKAQIEFENEQINNIEIVGKKIDNREYYPSITTKDRIIYVEVAGRMYPVKMGEAVIDQYTFNYDSEEDDYKLNYLVDKKRVTREDGIFMGNIYLYSFKTKTEVIGLSGSTKKREKALENGEFDLTFSTQFMVLFDVRLPSTEEYADPDLFKKYKDFFIEDEQIKPIEVKFYIDEHKNYPLQSYKVEPGITIGVNIPGTVNARDGSMTIYYPRKFLTNGKNFLGYMEDNLNMREIYSTVNPRRTWSGHFDENTIDTLEILSIKKYDFSVNSSDARLTDNIPRGQEMIFQNLFPISYSTKEDIMYTRSSGKPKREKRLYMADNEHFVLLSEVLKNRLVFYNRTENYSPTDGVINIDSEKNKEGVALYKENTKDILKARIYTDFIGFDEDNPNGLVQTEVSKRFFLNTASTSAFQNFMYSGYFNFVEPSLVVAKIENNNKYLPLNELNVLDPVSGETETFNFASSLDILNYSIFQVGAQIGLAYFSFPKYHIRLQFGVAGYIYQSGFARQELVADTTFNTTFINDDEFIANSLVWYPDLRMEFNPDPRFGLEIAYRPTYVNLLSRDVLQVDNNDSFIDSFGDNPTDKVVHVMQLAANIRVNKETNGQFFFRTNFSLSGDDRNTNFLQAQIGYAFNIFTNVEGKDDQARRGGPNGVNTK